MKNFAVIGNPISHSLSPEMHNAAILDLGIDADYTRKQLSIEQFDKEFPLFLKKIDGCNVTVPFKERVIPFLDELDDFAKKCGAVNTIVQRNSKWVGYNTDGLGYLLGLAEKRALHKNDRVLLIGAGGASKGIYLALKKKVGCQVTVANRTIQKAAEMIRDFENDRAISLDMAEEELGDFTVVIQTTSIGLPKTIDETPISLHHLKPGTICSDIIYNPAKTLFLKEAEKRQGIIQNGLPMFIHQGALAFSLWTGQKPSTDVMKKAVLASL